MKSLNKDQVSELTTNRLSVYLRCLNALEDAGVRARPQAQHSRHVMLFARRQDDAAGGWIERGRIETRHGHADIMCIDVDGGRTACASC